jgi:hypothetical protein
MSFLITIIIKHIKKSVLKFFIKLKYFCFVLQWKFLLYFLLKIVYFKKNFPSENIFFCMLETCKKFLKIKKIGLSRWILDICKKKKIKIANSIQQACIPSILAGKDLLIFSLCYY